MAIVWVREQWKDRAAAADEKAVREYVRSFKVLTDSMLTDAVAVTAAAGVPRMFDVYVGSDGQGDQKAATCRKIEAHQPDEDQPYLWLVICRYSTRTDQPELGDPDPLSRPAEVEWDWVSSTRVLEIDLDGKAVVNSSLEKFDPPVEVDDYRYLLRVTRYEAGHDVNQALAFKDAVNSQPFAGAAAGFAKMRPIKAVRSYENNRFYWRKTYEILFRGTGDPPFQPSPLDAGFRELLTGAGGVVAARNIFDQNGQPTQIPVPLNGLGQKLSDCNDKLAAAMDDATTTLRTTDGMGDFPLFPFDVQIGSEIMTVESQLVGGSANDFVVVRGARGTTRAAHANGVAITVLPVYRTFKGYPTGDFNVFNLL
jgi:hypothetical protein